MAKAAAKKDLPKVSVLDRRLANPFGFPSERIALKEGQWSLRWFSEALRTGRIYQAQQLGWEFVTPDDLAASAADIGALIQDGRIVRGENANREILMKMPQAMFDQIQNAKAEKNLRDIKSSSKTKDSIANRAASELGEQAADHLHNTNIEVMDERRSYDLEDESPAT